MKSLPDILLLKKITREELSLLQKQEELEK